MSNLKKQKIDKNDVQGGQLDNLGMAFGSKVRFKSSKVHISLRDRDFCLIGFDSTAFAIVQWDKKGQYNFDFYTGNVNKELELVEP